MTKGHIGFIGTGILGGAIAGRLLEQGFAVTVWNRSPDKTAPLVDAGAKAAATPAEAGRAPFVILCVTDAAAVESVVFGPDGVASAAGAEALLIDMSTTAADATRAMAERLEAACGMRWIDAPISGGAPAAERGAMTIMAGGREDDFERARPVWDAVAGRCTLMGPVGAGQATKMINQVLVLCGFQVIAEATALALHSGIDPARIPGALEGGRADSRLLREAMPLMAAQEGPPIAKNVNNLKDLEMIHDLARATRTPLPVTGLVTELHRQLLQRGLGDACPTTLVKLLTSGT